MAPEVAARIPDHERIIGFRHVLVHGYSEISQRVVWDALKNELPLLLPHIEGLLAEE